MATELRCLHGFVVVTLGHAADLKLRLLCSAPQGDNDPVDVVEIGSTKLDMGGVYEARPFVSSVAACPQDPASPCCNYVAHV